MHTVAIAIVEDDMPLAEMYKFKLEKAGYHCEIAINGKQGLELAEKMKPDLVLLDLMLPEIPGDEMLAQMRQTDWGKDIKVLVMTNISEYEAPETLKKLNVMRYVVKAQHTPTEVVKMIEEALRTK